MSLLLQNKNIVIYGAGGSVGTAMALAFAEEGAKVFLTDHKTTVIQNTAKEIMHKGGVADFAKVNALDQTNVENHLNQLTNARHTIDISFNLIGIKDVQGFPLLKMEMEDFLMPITLSMQSQFITIKAAAKKMSQQRSGVILMLTANAGKSPSENTGGFGVACSAMEGLTRQFAAELGEHNIRVVCLRSAGSPDAKGVREVFEEHAKLANISREEFEQRFAGETMLKRLPKLHEVAAAAVLMASDKASAVTSAIINITCGGLSD